MITFSKIGYMGRFGNEMFQYALIYAVSKETGYPFELDWNLGRKYFGLPHREIPETTSVFRENPGGGRFDASVFDVKDGTDFVGFFQSEKYFVKYKEAICDLYTPTDEYQEAIDRRERELFDPDRKSIIVQLRGTDYLNRESIECFGGIPGTGFYRDALDAICTKDGLTLDDYSIVLITDDIPVSKRILSFIPNLTIAKLAPIEQMFLMACADRLVITASTFAWWGAWLNPREDLQVYAPEYWRNFAAKSEWNPKDIAVPGWEFLAVNDCYAKRNYVGELKVKFLHFKRLLGIHE